jgi:hypothetical protein
MAIKKYWIELNTCFNSDEHLWGHKMDIKSKHSVCHWTQDCTSILVHKFQHAEQIVLTIFTVFCNTDHKLSQWVWAYPLLPSCAGDFPHDLDTIPLYKKLFCFHWPTTLEESLWQFDRWSLNNQRLFLTRRFSADVSTMANFFTVCSSVLVLSMIIFGCQGIFFSFSFFFHNNKSNSGRRKW